QLYTLRNVSVLINKYGDNGMFRFESIPTNNERAYPFVVRKRRERKELNKDIIPFGLKLFFPSSTFQVL
ncbi:hypothetical protein KAU32_02175, partial [bacterium]|nr:hypothetical protein [bacterium]